MNIPPSIKESDRWTIRGLIRIVVALALIGLIFSYPGALSSPYSDTGFDGYYENQIVEQASDIESIEHPKVTNETSVYQYSELSPVAKEVFDKTRSEYDNSFTIFICHEWVLTCDEYYKSEVPDEFRYGAAGHTVGTSDLYTVIEDEGGAYVFQTGALGHGDGFGLFGPLLALSSYLMVLLVSGVLIHNVIRPPKHSSNRFAPGDVVVASLIGIFALAVPYLHMWELLPASLSRVLLTGIIALGVPVYYFELR